MILDTVASMTLEIHVPNADDLAQQLAAATGEDVETAVVRAIEERLARVPRRPSADRDAELDALFEQLARLPVLRPPHARRNHRIRPRWPAGVMVIDTSAIFAAITGEPDSVAYRNAIKSARLCLISTITLLEMRIVLFSRGGPNAISILDQLIEQAGAAIVPLTSCWRMQHLTLSSDMARGNPVRRD